MSSIAEQLRREQRDAVRAMSPAERVSWALRLGDADVETYASAQGLEREEARRRLRRRRQSGRRKCSFLQDPT